MKSFTYNITFVISHGDEARFLHYLRKELVPALFNETTSAKDPQLRKVIESGGVKPSPGHGLSIAISATFASEEDACQWFDNDFMSAADGFPLKFGKDSVFFATLLQNLTV
ncbi:MAG: DUF4286 family protein [Muribaculaceae bacterium]|nr:DUF4286 family protein [Muribaculaceae bacterium]